MGRIVVGVDGSDEAQAAFDWALAHADDDDTVIACHAWSLPAVMGFEAPTFSLAEVEVAAHKLVKEMIAAADRDDGPTLQSEVIFGHPGPVLIEQAEGADLVVVGSRGFGGFKGLLLGSVSTYVIHHATCPVATIPGPDDD